MPKNQRRRSKSRPRNFAWEIEFEQAVRQLPPPSRRSLLIHLRRRPRPHRIFYQLDPATGTWHRL